MEETTVKLCLHQQDLYNTINKLKECVSFFDFYCVDTTDLDKAIETTVWKAVVLYKPTIQ